MIHHWACLSALKSNTKKHTKQTLGHDTLLEINGVLVSCVFVWQLHQLLSPKMWVIFFFFRQAVWKRILEINTPKHFSPRIPAPTKPSPMDPSVKIPTCKILNLRWIDHFVFFLRHVKLSDANQTNQKNCRETYAAMDRFCLVKPTV